METIFKIKRLYILLLLPLIVATQCDDDDLSSGFETEYIIQNDTSLDLILFTEGGGQLPVASQSDLSVASDLNQTTDPISPSESFIFSNIKLYKMENDNFILAYQQNPIDDNLWVLSEPSENRFQYKLIITDALID
ncbi:hypothetical protein [uncultured Winogradskyella sp.]|uniref:hypothetical protein n=1 Tax=uncultured Winogradskyella sp. TaxID=395353 RepID=UPI002613F312|nr:hypothetical protein [uncultured Winogradskyella sp.]